MDKPIDTGPVYGPIEDWPDIDNFDF